MFSIILSSALSAVCVALFVRWRLDADKAAQYAEEQFEAGKATGKNEAKLEIEKIKEERNLDYRTAARVYAEECASCGKKCLHCAKAKKQLRVDVEPVGLSEEGQQVRVTMTATGGSTISNIKVG